MPFEKSSNSETTSVLVKLRGNALNHIISLKSRLMQKTGKDIGKSEAVVILLNRMPKETIEQAISSIISTYSPEPTEPAEPEPKTEKRAKGSRGKVQE